MDSEKVCTIVLPVLIIIRGNSASGKTTIAKRLQQKFGRNTMLFTIGQQYLHKWQCFR